jgi:hypothetical protein
MLNQDPYKMAFVTDIIFLNTHGRFEDKIYRVIMAGLFLRDTRFTRRDGRGVRSRRLTM